jgi:uncharacterized protein (DUF2252 family)
VFDSELYPPLAIKQNGTTANKPNTPKVVAIAAPRKHQMQIWGAKPTDEQRAQNDITDIGRQKLFIANRTSACSHEKMPLIKRNNNIIARLPPR